MTGLLVEIECIVLQIRVEHSRNQFDVCYEHKYSVFTNLLQFQLSYYSIILFATITALLNGENNWGERL